MREFTKDQLEFGALKTGEALLGLVPGGSILSASFTVPLELAERKRNQDILASIQADLTELSLNLSEMTSSDAFMANLIEIVRASQSTSDQGKRKLLRNALVNSIRDAEEAFGIKEHFLKLISAYSVSHVMVLKFFGSLDPYVSREVSLDEQGVFRDVVTMAKAEFPQLDALILPLTSDMQGDGLLEFAQDLTAGAANIASRPDSITPMGEDFLTFLRDPLSEEH